jgi:hypothetical protein
MRKSLSMHMYIYVIYVYSHQYDIYNRTQVLIDHCKWVTCIEFIYMYIKSICISMYMYVIYVYSYLYHVYNRTQVLIDHYKWVTGVELHLFKRAVSYKKQGTYLCIVYNCAYLHT